MTTSRILSERRMSTGTPGTDFSLAAIVLPNGAVNLESRYVSYEAGERFLIFNRRTIHLALVPFLAGAVREVLVSAMLRAEPIDTTAADFVVAESAFDVPGGRISVVVSASFGDQWVFVEELPDEGEASVIVGLPFASAFDFLSGLNTLSELALSRSWRPFERMLDSFAGTAPRAD